MKYYRKALDKNPKNPYAIYNIGYIYQMQGEKQKAVEMYEKLIAMNPQERAAESTEPFQAGRKLTDMAKDNLKSLKAAE
jgi:tetratricopeptide (TPR) repeat protein